MRYLAEFLLTVVNLHASIAYYVVWCQDRSGDPKSHPPSRICVETSLDLLYRF